MSNDLIKRLEIKAGAEKIAWGSDTSLMREAAHELRSLYKDKIRLDWLADRENKIGNVLLPNNCVEANFTDMRAAIDAAMLMPNAKLRCAGND